MEGGGSEPIRLGDISNYKEVSDLYPMASGTLLAMNIAIGAGRFGGLGGFSFNTYFDTFGLEGVLANMCLVLIMIQLARFVYTTFYNAGGTKPWSPLVFVCILIGAQVAHDLLFYYGAIKMIPTGQNEMIDVLKRYADENGSRALYGHSLFLIIVSVAAMILKETSVITSFVVVNILLYLLPFVITTFSKKSVPAAPLPPVETEAPKQAGPPGPAPATRATGMVTPRDAFENISSSPYGMYGF